MANFCRYCGKQINGAVCDCPKAIAAVEKTRAAEAMAQERQEHGTAGGEQNTQQQTHQTAKPFASGPGNEQLGGMKELLLGFWKRPAATLQKALQTSNKVPQYLVTALFAVVLFVISYLIGKNGKAALGITVCCVGLRAVYALGAYGMAKKANPELTLSDTMGIFSITFFLDTVLVLLLFISVKMGLYELIIAFLLLWFLSAAISSLLATWMVTGQKMDLSYKITVILLAVITILVVFVMRKAVTDMALGMLNGMVNDYANPLGLLGNFM